MTTLNIGEFLADVDAVVWPRIGFSHCEDPAAALRDMVSDDEEVVRKAASSLWAALRTRVPAYPATVQCVPFLARLCVAGVMTETLLELLHSVAHGEDQPRGDQDELWAAVAAELPLLLPLLAGADEEIRRWMIRVVALCGPSREAAEAIRARWADETDSVLRSELLNACRRADPDIAAELGAAATGPDEGPEIRLSAAVSLVRTGAAWTAELADAATAWALAGSRMEPGERWFDTRTGEWKDTDPDDESFTLLLLALAGRGELAVAAGLLETVLAAGGSGRGFRNRRALDGIAALCGEYRSAPALLAPLLVPLVADEEDVVSAIAVAQLHSLGPEGRCGVDAVLTVASRQDGGEKPADAALALLVSLGEPRAVPLLARDLPARPDALETAVGSSWRGDGLMVGFDATLLQAARDLLRNPDRRNYGAPRRLCALLGSWGAQAAPALPELYALLDKEPEHAPGAVAAVAAGTGDSVEAETRIRAAAESASTCHRMFAAAALHRLTGDSTQLVAALGPGLDGVLYEKRYAAARAAQLGPAAEPLLPRLRELLVPERAKGAMWGLGDCLSAASAIHAIAGEAAGDELVPLLSAALDSTPQAKAEAARLARRVGAPAAHLAPKIAPLLNSLNTVLPAARTLLELPGAVGPEGVVEREQLAEFLLVSVEHNAHSHQAVGMLKELGGGVLAPRVADRLRELLAGDQRPPARSFDFQRIRNDQHRVAAIQAALHA